MVHMPTIKKFWALYNTVGWWEWEKCLYPTRLDTYGQGCSHNCSYCYARSLLAFRWLRHPNNPKFIDLKTAYKIIAEENLNKTEAYNFINSAFRDGYVTTTGIAITKVIPPVPLFTKDNARSNLIQRVLDKITAFFEKFRTISVKPMEE